MVFNKKVYDVLKWIAMYLLPALGTLYFALARIWTLPYGEEVLGTFTAVDTFLGIILGISKACYGGDGEITFEKEDEASIALNLSDEEINNGQLITLKVKGA